MKYSSWIVVLCLIVVATLFTACGPQMHYAKGQDGLTYTKVTGTSSPGTYYNNKRDESRTRVAISEGRTLEIIEAEIQEARRMGKHKLYRQLIREKQAAIRAATLYQKPRVSEVDTRQKSSRRTANRYLRTERPKLTFP